MPSGGAGGGCKRRAFLSFSERDETETLTARDQGRTPFTHFEMLTELTPGAGTAGIVFPRPRPRGRSPEVPPSPRKAGRQGRCLESALRKLESPPPPPPRVKPCSLIPSKREPQNPGTPGESSCPSWRAVGSSLSPPARSPPYSTPPAVLSSCYLADLAGATDPRTGLLFLKPCCGTSPICHQPSGGSLESLAHRVLPGCGHHLSRVSGSQCS